MNIVVALDGVLRSLAGGTPIQEGRLLLEALKSVGVVFILTDESEDRARRWLSQNNVFSFDFILDSKVDLNDGVPLRQRQVQVLAAKRGKISLFVDHEPMNVAWAMGRGITSLLFTHPIFALPNNRPDTMEGKRSWEEITKTYEKQAQSREVRHADL